MIMVSSGAIAEGMKRLGWATRPHEINELQAAAAVGQMGLAQMYETKLRENGMGSRAGAADARRPGRPRALPQRALDAAHAAAAQCRARDQRERHGGQRRDQVRRQRHAGCAGRQPGRSRCAGDPHGPEGPVQRRPAQGPGRHLRQRSARRRPRARSHGRRRGLQPRPRRHDHQDPGGQARRGVGRLHRDRLGPRTRLPAAAGPRRSHRHPAGGADPEEPGAQALDGRITCSCAAR